MNLYDLPKYYDLSYSYNMQDELAFLKRIFTKYTNTKQPYLLEPACGTGRLLVPLVRAGFKCAGFDLNRNALAYLKKNCNVMVLKLASFRLTWQSLILTVQNLMEHSVR